MKRNLATLLMLTVVFLYSCKCHRQDENLAEIKGQLKHSKGEKIYLEELKVKGSQRVDSVLLNEDGEFIFRLKLKEPSFYTLKISNNNFVNLLVAPGEKIWFTGEATQLAYTFQVKGSVGSEMLWRIEKEKQSVYRLFDSLQLVWKEHMYDDNSLKIRDYLDSIARNRLSVHRDTMRQLIKRNPTSLGGLFVLYQRIGRQAVFTLEENLQDFESLANALQTTYPNNEHAIDFAKRVNDFKKEQTERIIAESRLIIGQPLPELCLFDKEGKKHCLSELKGKTVLLHFWSSRNTQSRHDNVEWARLHKKYTRKGFEIYGVSFDENEILWTGAINIDKLPGIQVRGNRTVEKLFNLKELPRNFLIDKEGNLMAKDLDQQQVRIKLYELYDYKSNTQ